MSRRTPLWFFNGASSAESIEDRELEDGEPLGVSLGETTAEFAELEMAESRVTVRCTADLVAGIAVVEAIVLWESLVIENGRSGESLAKAQYWGKEKQFNGTGRRWPVVVEYSQEC